MDAQGRILRESSEWWVVCSEQGSRGQAPCPVFLEMFILKSFKSCVLELFIVEGLRANFSQVRMLKRLGEKQLKVEFLKLKEEGMRSEFLADAWGCPHPLCFL